MKLKALALYDRARERNTSRNEQMAQRQKAKYENKANSEINAKALNDSRSEEDSETEYQLHEQRNAIKKQSTAARVQQLKNRIGKVEKNIEIFQKEIDECGNEAESPNVPKKKKTNVKKSEDKLTYRKSQPKIAGK